MRSETGPLVRPDPESTEHWFKEQKALGLWYVAARKAHSLPGLSPGMADIPDPRIPRGCRLGQHVWLGVGSDDWSATQQPGFRSGLRGMRLSEGLTSHQYP